ncbi:MAG: RHS repeat-associated core domain-containing protein [Lentisphaeria bacterium]|nr:RHS repeat-associated core domain-containing protein [Lentisphaeria bacterium]
MVCPVSQPPGLRLRRPQNRKSCRRHFTVYTTGLRSYSPVLGRWINRDPIGEMGGENLYLLINNSPIIEIDLLGLSLFPKVDVSPIINALKSKVTAITCSKGLDLSMESIVRTPFSVPYLSVQNLKCKGELKVFWGTEEKSKCKTPTGDWDVNVVPSDAKTMDDGEYGFEIKAEHPAAKSSGWFYLQAQNARHLFKSSLKARVGFRSEAEVLLWNEKPCCKCLHVNVIVSCEAKVHERATRVRKLAAGVIALYAVAPVRVASASSGAAEKKIIIFTGKKVLEKAAALAAITSISSESRE